MLKPVESAIEMMDRLKAELLAAEIQIEAMNAQAELGLERMRAEMAAFDPNAEAAKTESSPSSPPQRFATSLP